MTHEHQLYVHDLCTANTKQNPVKLGKALDGIDRDTQYRFIRALRRACQRGSARLRRATEAAGTALAAACCCARPSCVCFTMAEHGTVFLCVTLGCVSVCHCVPLVALVCMCACVRVTPLVCAHVSTLGAGVRAAATHLGTWTVRTMPTPHRESARVCWCCMALTQTAHLLTIPPPCAANRYPPNAATGAGTHAGGERTRHRYV